ncbi:hypothetical protein J437_LFUL014739 [Ladona fulva]|uniref:Uncharacterized protein n=1 Tax=Ladona fulva TaxID=123851 RepID=A0A8K0P6U2_LADFU|nr:hypothetical protein J437_LFUL014739 [Ladona fulva]
MLNCRGHVIMKLPSSLDYSHGKGCPCISYSSIVASEGIVSVEAPLPTGDNGYDTKLFDLAKSVHWIVEDGQDAAGMRRKRKIGGVSVGLMGDDSEEDDFSGAPPANDIYRARQQKRVK